MDDQIDVLVDLGGHTGQNRMPLFGLKPAPVQVAYIGYPDTSGIQAMDYRITDSWADPPWQPRWYSEELVHMPTGFLAYRPPSGLPDVAPLPALQNGYITFGSFNNLAKVTPETVELWAATLHSVPNSRLVIKSKALRDAKTCEWTRERFAEQGIASERIDLFSHLQGVGEHLEYYRMLDIALDPFPYHGTTTTCESLVMGVPVISLAGPYHSCRVGVSLLSRVGLSEMIATTPEEFINRASGLAAHIGELSLLRRKLRGIVMNSALCNATAVTRCLEAAYREMWKKWCAEGTQHIRRAG
jgi:predicted O-linked N-acetylglucosamine transferase (SPINDLY family)